MNAGGRSRTWAIAAALLLYVVLVARFWFVCDDAFISFRFAQNWAHGHGLVFNPGEFPPVEGYSNLLWTVMCAGLEVVGLSPAAWAPVVSAACGAVLMWRFHAVAQRLELPDVPALLAGLALAGAPAVGVWATSGLATMPHALLVFLLAEAWVFNESSRDGVAPLVVAGALCLLRTEGIGWVLVVALAAVLERGTLRRTQGIARALAPILAVFAVFTLWRFHYYGTIWPHIALTKVSFGLRSLGRGIQYVSLFWLTCVTPLVALLPATWLVFEREHGRRWAAIAWLALVFPLYAVVVGGDFMPFGRLLLPGLPFACLLLAAGLGELQSRTSGLLVMAVGGALVLVQLAPAADLHLVPEAVRRLVHFRLSDKTYLSEANRWVNQQENTVGFTQRGRALAQVAEPGDMVVTAAAGAVGYYSGLEVLDQHGLVTAEVGHRPMPMGPLTRSPGHDKHVEPEFFVKYAPRFLYARAVQGKLAAGRMKDTLEQWRVERSVMDRYVPDYYEVFLAGEDQRTFLFVVRRRESHEDPARIWADFPARRRELNAELRAQYADEAEFKDDDPG